MTKHATAIMKSDVTRLNADVRVVRRSGDGDGASRAFLGLKPTTSKVPGNVHERGDIA